MVTKLLRITLTLILSLFSITITLGQEIPNNGIDDDNDGFVDCFDSELFGTSDCSTFYFGQPIPECREKPPVLDKYTLEEKFRTDQSNYPVDQRCGVFVADVGNDDPYPELIAMASSNSSPGNRVYIFSGVDGSIVQYFQAPSSIKSYSQAVVGDVDEDGFAEIFANVNKTLYRFDYDNSVGIVGNTGTAGPSGDLWSDASSPQLADFNGDGIPEVYIENHIYNARTMQKIMDGGSLNSGKIEGDASNNGDAWPIAYDVFKPGDIIPNSGGLTFGDEALGLELIAGNDILMVDFRDSTMSVGLSANLTDVNGGDGFTSISDLNGDDRIDVIVTSLNSSNNAGIYAWDPYTGNQIGTTYEINGSSKHAGRCNVADFDNDNQMEIGTAGKHEYVVIEYDSDAEQLVKKWNKPGVFDGSERTGSTVFDFEGDGNAEVVYSEENKLYIWKGTDGSTLVDTTSPSGTRTDYPLVADADGDGQAEIIITVQDVPGPSNSGPGYVVVYRSKDAPWVPARETWNQHGYHITNIDKDIIIPAEQQAIVDPSFSTAFNQAFNGFLVQTTFLTEFADPTFAVSDLTTENVIVSLDQCVAQDSVEFTVTLENNGDWKAPRYTPIAIFDGDPYVENAVYLGTILTPDNVPAGGSIDITHTVYDNDGDGTMDLYVLVNHYEDNLAIGDALPAPLDSVSSPTMECDYVNNVGFIVSITNCNVSNVPRLDLDRDNSSGVTGNGFKKAFGVGSLTGTRIADEDIFIIDDDNENMASATITLTNRPDGTSEYLQHPNAGGTYNGISISTYNSTTGEITLTGTASLLTYEDAIYATTYKNDLDNTTITADNRIIEIQVSDGTNNSNIAVDTVLIEYQPTLDLDYNNSSGASDNDYITSYTENGAPVKIVDSDVYIETNGLDIEKVTIQHTNIKDGAYEGLEISGTLPAGITVTNEYEYSVGLLELSGTASPADYQTALKRITYVDSSDAPNITDRVFTIVATDIYLESLTATSTVSITAVNDAPTITGPADSIFYNEGDAAVNIVEYDFIVDIDDTDIESAEIAITNNFDGTEDVLNFSNQNGISGSYDSGTGILSLTGTATKAQYQTAIATITYENTDGVDASAGRRTISVTVNDGDANSAPYTRDIYINVAPAITSASTVNIDDGVTAVLTVTASDANVGDTKTYSITGGADAGDFSIGAATGALTLNVAADYATKSTYTVIVTVEDQGGLTNSQTITVNVNNPANPSPAISDATIAIDEDAGNGTLVVDINDDNSGNDTDDGGEAITYSITNGNDDGIFTIDGANGEITILDNSLLDYETTQSYELTIKAEDPSTNSDNAIITININNLNDNEPVIANATVSVSEDKTNGYVVYDINEVNTGNDTDLDGETLDYTIQSGNTDNIFGIGLNTGIITIADDTNLDFESAQQYLLTVRADDGLYTVDSVITINITGINDNNPVISDNTANVDEGAAKGTSVYDVNDDNTGTDQDIDLENLTYSIVAGNSSGVFTIDDATGEITIFDNTNLDYELVTQFVLTIRADDGVNTDDAQITVDVNDLSEFNPVISDNTVSISEDATNGTGVYDINEDNTGNDTDQDGQALTYSISAGNDDGIFGIDANTGEITVADNTNLDYETTTQYILTVVAEDTDTNTDNASITINVDNVNDNNPVIVDATVSIDENSANTTSVYDVNEDNTGSDTDLDGEALTYSITAGNGSGVFAIDPATGEITVADNTNLDYETTQQFVLTVEASDGTNTDVADITIDVNNLNDNNPVIVDASTSIDEDATIGVSVYDVNEDNTGNDTDLDGEALTYSITAGNDDGVFGIDPGSGAITIADNSTLDYESVQQYVLTVEATDGTNSDVADITIDINNLNDNNPVIVDASTSIDENAANTTSVYDVNEDNTGNDTDLDGEALTYSITAGNDLGVFAIDPATGEITVADNTNLDYETTQQFAVTVETTDGTNTDVADITIDVNNLNDNNPVIVDATVNLSENSSNGDGVYNVNDDNTGNDTDLDGESLTYSITAGNDDAIFGIDPGSGAITVADNTNLDYETTNQYVLTVQATDGVNSDVADITVNIDDAAENGPIISDFTTSIPENASNSTAVYDVNDANTGNDTDADGQALTYSITAGNDDGVFGINGTTGEIIVADNSSLDFETTNSYILTIEAEDTDLNTDNAFITINITDIPENNPVIVDHTTSIAEDATNGTAIYDVNDDNTGNDTDADGQALTYSITAGNGDGIFGIDAATGEITVADNTNLDYETTASYSLTVQAEDNDANTDDAIITINVTNVNEFNPVIADNTVSIPETIANGANVYDINDENTGNDTDADGQLLTYTIISGNGDGVFALNAATGEITIADNSAINVVATPSYILNVVAQDGDLNTDDADITINITDMATNNPVIVDHTTSIAEDATNGTAIYDVNDDNTGNDTDLDGQALTYSITAGNADGVFGIDAATGEITVVDNTNLDYETTTSYSLTVQAEDTDANTDDAIITIDITDVAEGNNPVIVDHTTSIAEDATNGTAIYDVNDDNTGNDTDADGQAITYSITAGNEDGVFGIDAATGEITVVDNTNLDYETTTSYSLTVQAEDTDANTDDAIITIDITDVAEGNNPVIVDHTTSIAEDATNGTAIYDVNDDNTGNDTDLDGQALTYSITAGNGDGIFGIDAATGEITVVDNTNLDYETTTSYSLTIQAEDTDANTDDAIITIDITDVVEGANPDIADADVYLDEDAENDTFVYDVNDINTGDDTDSDGQELTYDIMDGNDDGIFIIDATNGEIKVGDNSNLDYESNSSYDLTVEATDTEDNSDQAVITIYIVDKTEAITVPEGFSPNNDGFNDAFVINGLEPTDKVDIKIYNRWGTLIFEDGNYNNDWDGRANANMSLGKNVPSGTYFYIIKINGNDKEISGYVYMKR